MCGEGDSCWLKTGRREGQEVSKKHQACSKIPRVNFSMDSAQKSSRQGPVL